MYLTFPPMSPFGPYKRKRQINTNEMTMIISSVSSTVPVLTRSVFAVGGRISHSCYLSDLFSHY